MKIFSVILLLFTSFFTAIGEKYALIIAVGDYPEEGHWPDISSQNDLNHVKYTLLRLGFSESNIATISDTQATRQGIINALILLRDKISTDDQVYIHFSGHGQQVVDQNGDEIDRLDEAIVPYDSPLDYVEGVYEGQNLIRDEELGAFIDEMRRKIGSNGQIILVLDSCHSGTGTRGMGKARGTFKIMGKLQGQSNIHTLENTESTESAEGLNMAPLAAFFGSSPRELNYETKDDQGLPVGSLTFALTSVISELNSEASFEEVFQRVKQKMSYLAPRQNPQFEGIGDLLFLESGKSAHSHEGKVIALQTNGNCVIDLGTLSGVFPGSQVEISDDDKPQSIIHGDVIHAGLNTAEVVLKDSIALDKTHYYNVKITQYSENPVTISIANKIDKSDNLHQVINKLLDIVPSRGADDNSEIFVLHEQKKLMLQTKDGTNIFETDTENDTSAWQNDIKESIRAYEQSQFLRKYENHSDRFDFELKMHVVDCNNISNILNVVGDEIHIGTCVQFEVINHGIAGAYFSILDIQPDNLINLVIPSIELGHTPDEYFLEPGQSYKTSFPIEIAQPVGVETLKLVLSPQPLHLQKIIASKGRNTRGVESYSSFEKMFSDLYKTNTRGARIKKNRVEDISVISKIFRIII